MNELYMLAGMAAVTFAIRYSMFLLAGQMEFPIQLVKALRFVPPAVLAALIVPAVLMPTDDEISLSLTNPYLMGGLVAFGVSWFSQNLLLTIVLGMAAFWGWQGVLWWLG
jgi:branched-subunit amino acid transport protein